MKLIALQDFSWAHQHVNIKDYKVGEEIDTDDEDLIAVAQTEGWASEDGKKPAAKKNAPETKNAGNAPENK